jgi:glycosyltransferase involved in cell wall biosynthesis
MTQQNPRIIFFISAFFPFPTGATYSAIRLARTLREKGVRVEWIVDDRDGAWLNGGEYEGFDVKSFYLNRTGKLKKLEALFAFTRYLWSKRRDFDIFHIHGGGHMNVLIAGWVKLLFPRKKVMLKCTSDGWDTPDGIAKEKYGRLLLWIYRRLDGVVAMTSGKYDKLVEYECRGKLAVIPNGTDCDLYKPDPGKRSEMRDKLRIPQDVPLLANAGWLGKGKGTDVLFKVWSQLLERVPNLYLLTIGDYRKDRDADTELIQLFNETGLDPALLTHPQFVRVGHVEDAEHYLQTADIFVFPSRKEGFGTVQTEAMACGLPCIVNDLLGVSCDIYPDESVGFRVQDNEVEEYVRIISSLLTTPTEREKIGGTARQRVLDHFSLESVGQRYLDFYKNLCFGGCDESNF